MKYKDIYLEIDKNYNKSTYSEMSKSIISRLKLDNNTKYKIYTKNKNYCTVKLKNKDITCKLHLTYFNYSFTYYSFTYKRNNDIESHSITNATKNELLVFLDEHGLLNNIRESVIEHLIDCRDEDDILVEYTRKIFDVLTDDVFTKTGSYLTDTVDLKYGLVLCYFNN